MIISASRRTDIPRFYSEWFFNRVREGFVATRNPFNADQVAKWRLDAETVDAIVFWTKDPAPMLGRLRELDERGFVYYFQFTLTPYGRDVEPGVRGKDAVADTFRRLAEAVGPERVIWHYDPVFLGKAHTEEWHAERFGSLADALHDCTKRVVISFLDADYRAVRRMGQESVRGGTAQEQDRLAGRLSGIARAAGLEMSTCAEEADLSRHDIGRGRCIDAALIERISGRARSGCAFRAARDKNQRDSCGCVESVDIGAYNTCAHGCAYCYANFNPGVIAENRRRHDPASPALLGGCDAAALGFRAGQRSLWERQGRLF
ncbi:DUF1848 domain-containing protein [Gordonibacter sp. An230]|uniref:DUF1848 domain-containing protein n=1 Tax=Gordonibacter sp. An230 TaxID=1965592 RepID=UPI0013A61A23|nr:DUF1848 domain-containing protein [Gordonibacter sp. An230]